MLLALGSVKDGTDVVPATLTIELLLLFVLVTSPTSTRPSLFWSRIPNAK